MLTNPRDAFRGRSREPNMVPFDMLGMVPCIGIYNFVRTSQSHHFWLNFKNAVPLKTGLRVRQGHWKCHHSIERIWFPI